MDDDRWNAPNKLVDIAQFRWILLRHPLHLLYDFAETNPPRTKRITYYDFTSPQNLELMFSNFEGRADCNPKLDVKGWGDSITSRATVDHVTEAADVARATSYFAGKAPDMAAEIGRYRWLVVVDSNTMNHAVVTVDGAPWPRLA